MFEENVICMTSSLLNYKRGWTDEQIEKQRIYGAMGGRQKGINYKAKRENKKSNSPVAEYHPLKKENDNPPFFNPWWVVLIGSIPILFFILRVAYGVHRLNRENL